MGLSPHLSCHPSWLQLALTLLFLAASHSSVPRARAGGHRTSDPKSVTSCGSCSTLEPRFAAPLPLLSREHDSARTALGPSHGPEDRCNSNKHATHQQNSPNPQQDIRRLGRVAGPDPNAAWARASSSHLCLVRAHSKPFLVNLSRTPSSVRSMSVCPFFAHAFQRCGPATGQILASGQAHN
jgi:hypothetical protein